MESQERNLLERDFHDRKYKKSRKKDYYAHGFTGTAFQGLLARIGDVTDRSVLEFGCGEGWLTKLLASKGARVRTFDISREAVLLTRSRLAPLEFRHPVSVEQMAGEALAYREGSFDLVVGIAILHHLDLERAAREISRVLKRGGRAVFMEPLGHNPLVRAWRRLTPGRRSKDEAPLLFEQIDVLGRSFSRLEHEEYYLTALFALPLHFLGLNPLMLKARDRLHSLDGHLLRAWPWLSRHCWYSVLTMEK